MTRLVAVLCLGLLAGCGVDGEPITPGEEEVVNDVVVNTPEPQRPPVTGNVTLGTNGSSASVGTSIISGNVSVHVGTSF